MKYTIQIAHIKRGLQITYEGREFPNEEAATDYGQRKALFEFGPGPWDRGEIIMRVAAQTALETPDGAPV